MAAEPGAIVPGKLQTIAVELFQRAYGLNGYTKEDHEVLQREAIQRTGCSPKAFQELVIFCKSATSTCCVSGVRSLVPFNSRQSSRASAWLQEESASAARSRRSQSRRQLQILADSAPDAAVERSPANGLVLDASRGRAVRIAAWFRHVADAADDAHARAA